MIQTPPLSLIVTAGMAAPLPRDTGVNSSTFHVELSGGRDAELLSGWPALPSPAADLQAMIAMPGNVALPADQPIGKPPVEFGRDLAVDGGEDLRFGTSEGLSDLTMVFGAGESDQRVVTPHNPPTVALADNTTAPTPAIEGRLLRTEFPDGVLGFAENRLTPEKGNHPAPEMMLPAGLRANAAEEGRILADTAADFAAPAGQWLTAASNTAPDLAQIAVRPAPFPQPEPRFARGDHSDAPPSGAVARPFVPAITAEPVRAEPGILADRQTPENPVFVSHPPDATRSAGHSHLARHTERQGHPKPDVIAGLTPPRAGPSIEETQQELHPPGATETEVQPEGDESRLAVSAGIGPNSIGHSAPMDLPFAPNTALFPIHAADLAPDFRPKAPSFTNFEMPYRSVPRPLAKDDLVVERPNPKGLGQLVNAEPRFPAPALPQAAEAVKPALSNLPAGQTNRGSGQLFIPSRGPAPLILRGQDDRLSGVGDSVSTADQAPPPDERTVGPAPRSLSPAAPGLIGHAPAPNGAGAVPLVFLGDRGLVSDPQAGMGRAETTSLPARSGTVAAPVMPAPDMDLPDVGTDGPRLPPPGEVPAQPETAFPRSEPLAVPPSGPALRMEGPIPPLSAAPAPPPIREQAVHALLGQVGKLEDGRVEVVLAPADLGRMWFDIRFQGDEMRIHVTAERPETLETLRRHADQLVLDLRQGGFANGGLGQGMLSFGGSPGQEPPATNGHEADRETGREGAAPPAKWIASSAITGLNLRL